MEKEIRRHQEVQELQGKIQEVFILSFQNNYTKEKTIQVLQNIFSSIEDEELDRRFREKYNACGTMCHDEKETLFI